LGQLRGSEEDGLLIVIHDVAHYSVLGWSQTYLVIYQQFLERHEKNPSKKNLIAFLLNNLILFQSNKKIV
jgi:hypothetical protein